MVNPNRLIKITKAESKDLLDKAQNIIDKDILGPNFKRDKLLKKDKKKDKVKIDGEEVGTIVDGELSATIKTKTKVPKPDAKTDQILFNVKAGGKITPKMLDDFNIEKFNSKDDILKFIDEISNKYKKDINVRKRGTQSQEATKNLAKLLQKDQTKLTNSLLNLKKGETLNAEYILATRELVEASYAKLDILAQKAITGTPDDVLAFRQHMALTSELTKILKGVQTETARALNQFKIKTSGKNRFGKVDLEELNKRDFLLEIGGEDEIRGFAKVYLKEIDSGQARVKMVEGIGTATKISQAFSEVFINAILSNPLTHVRNTAGNWITQGIIAQEHKLASKIFGGKVEGGIAAYEDIARAYGKTQAYTEMWAAIGRSLKGEMPSIDSMIQGNKVEVREGKFTAGFFNQEQGSNAAKFTDLAGKILTLNRIPTKFLTVADNYFKNLEYRSELYALAYRETLEKINNNVLAKDKAAEYLADRVVNPKKSMVEEAFEAAKYSTFQTKLGTRGDFLDLGSNLQKLKGNVGPANFIANYYLPFIQTPTNVAGFVLERSPLLNLVLKRYRDDLFSNNPARVQKAKAKMMLGSAFYLTVMGMNYGGFATGTSPELNTKNPSAKFQLKKTMGYGTGTINIPYGDETIRINMQNIAFDPLAMAFKQAADLSEIMQMGFRDNDQLQDYLRMLAAFSYSVGENLASSTFMSGVGKAINDYQNLKQLGAAEGGQKIIQGMFTSTFIPSVVKQGGKTIDFIQGENSQKLAVEFDEYIKKTLRYNDLNKQYDLLGDEVENWGAYTFEKKDPIRDELLKTKVEILPVRRSKTFSGGASGLTANVEYTAEELSFLQLRSGEYTKQLLSDLFETDEYLENDNFYKQALIKKAVSKARGAAYNDMIGVEFSDSLGAWENAEETAERLNSEKLKILEDKVITSNFGQPLEKTFEEYAGTEE